MPFVNFIFWPLHISIHYWDLHNCAFQIINIKNWNETKPCYVKGYCLPTISLCLIYVLSMVVKINVHNSKIQFPRWQKSISAVVKINFSSVTRANFRACTGNAQTFDWSAFAVKLVLVGNCARVPNWFVWFGTAYCGAKGQVYLSLGL